MPGLAISNVEERGKREKNIQMMIKRTKNSFGHTWGRKMLTGHIFNVRLRLILQGDESKSRNKENNTVELIKPWNCKIFLSVMSYLLRRTLAQAG